MTEDDPLAAIEAKLNWAPATDEEQLAAFRAECDKVGVPYNAEGLVRHHRGSAALTAGAQVYAEVRAVERQRDALQADLDATRAVMRDETDDPRIKAQRYDVIRVALGVHAAPDDPPLNR